MDNVLVFRRQAQQKSKLDNQEFIRLLNDKRFEMIEQKEDLLREKALYNELRSKGIDYLSEVEQGNAPPKEFIIRNL